MSLVNKDELIKMLKAHHMDNDNQTFIASETVHALEDLPTAKMPDISKYWIPCSFGYPPVENGRSDVCLVTLEDERIELMVYDGDKWFYVHPFDKIEPCFKVKAWMMLEPYRGE